MDEIRFRKLEESGFYEPYSHLARTLRGWLVAYGIGGPVLMMSQDLFSDAVVESGNGRLISILFLLGLALQIAEALIQKYSMAVFYESELDISVVERRRYRAAAFFTDQYLLSIVFDVATIAAFSIGTYLAMVSILAP